MNKAPIRVWREPVDGSTVAVIAMVEFVFRGSYHMASAWVLRRNDNLGWRVDGERALREHLLEEHGGHVPYIRRARDEGARELRERPLV